MKRFLLTFAVLTMIALSQARAESLDLILPGSNEVLRIEFPVQGESPTTRWNAFLDRWLDYFDTDGNGVLDQREAARIFPLQVPGKKAVPFVFQKADADNDSKVTRAELKAYYRRVGFTPVLAAVEPVSRQNLQVADALFRHLGPNAEGKLTLERFQRAAELLRKLDENEDEVLTPSEVLSLGVDPSLQATKQSEFAWLQVKNKTTGATIRAVGRVRHQQIVLTFSSCDAIPAKAAATSRQFVLAQYQSVAGKAQSIEYRQVEGDPSLQLLADVFPHADRNQDGKLSLAELEQFLGLLEQGVSCPLLVTLTDHGCNLFLHLDTNADGQLDLSELNTAAKQVKALGGEKGWTREQIPRCVHITLQPGFAGSAFGPLPLAVPSKTANTPSSKRSAKGPAWFQAMDKNGDGFLSPREFLGPQELFRRLDRNGDGVISVEEAEQP
jgi:Ca2+-binding EF-hand superfamily protein